MRTHARVVVIGGGIMGCSLLYHLTKLGWSDVVLVEKNELTAGSTWHAAGLCTHFAHNLTIMHMRAYSVRLYSSILERETGNPVSFHPCGALRVTRSEDRMDEFRHVRGIGRFAGFDFNILSPTELKEIYPLTETHDIIGAIHEPDDGHVDPSQATQALAAGARAGGAEIYRGNGVTGIDRSASGEWTINTSDGDIRAEHVVNAAGTWAHEIGCMLGLELPVVPMLHQYLVTDRIADVAERDTELPIIRDPEESWYVRQERDGVIIGPYEREGHPWSIDRVPPEFGMELLPPDLDRVEHIVAAAMARIPVLADAGLKTIVNGPITFTPDAGPLIGPAFNLDRAWLLTGSSMGVMEGGGAGKFLAEWMVGGEPPMDPLAVDSRRFGGYADRDYRVAKAVECFASQFAIHYPYEERPAGRDRRLTPVHSKLAQRDAVFGSVYGWERPNWFGPTDQSTDSRLSFRRTNWFTAVGRECRAVRDSVGIADMSVFAKFEVSGQDATAFMQTLGANTPPKTIGGVRLIHALSPSGGVLSEFTVTRTCEDSYYITSAAAAERHDHDLFRAHTMQFADVGVTCVTEKIGVLSVMGPESRELLRRVSEDDFANSAFPWFTARAITIADTTLRALRISYVGELGYELHHPMDRQERLFDTLIKAGARFDVTLFGAFAMNSMRLEKGYRSWGVDFTSERTPFEAGVDGLVKLDDRNFVGKSALEDHNNRPDRKRMVLLEITGDGPDPFYAHPVMRQQNVVGTITSGAYGHRTDKKLALAYLDADGARDGNDELTVEIIGESCPARILEVPPYDPGNKRLRDTA
ncbi:MAG: FAD-dependent oxidoreductase [Gammaproteobacteria bacterium]|nr:FAD-dependent oxidoreductase [Gammaproteobacteria bacterium]